MAKKASFRYDYARPALTVDVAIITTEAKPRVLLIQRKGEPYEGCWALPGGYVEEMEPLDVAARREVKEETGVEMGEIQQLRAFGNPGRDPRGWTVTIAYLSRVEVQEVKPIAADDAAHVEWFPLNKLPALAFDHAEILGYAKAKLQEMKQK
jgi:8-oxo-dGTP diphosphatase